MKSSLSATLFVLFFFLVDSLNAQIKADFGLSKNAGCSPLVVSFTNTSTGTSPNATFEWDFGNGNRSVLKDPGAVFTEAGNYAITLTVKDGSLSSTQSKQVTVYRSPEVDFSSSILRGCAPLPVNFIADAKPGDGTISSYSWDFGDGNTATTSSATSVHTYSSDQLASVSVTVANSYGCYTTVEKKDLIDVKQKLVSEFKPENNFLCTIDAVARFENRSTGPGQLTYRWDFGDGNTSQEISPTHVFNKSGAFTVKVIVNSSEGCTATETKMLNVANYKTDFSVPAVLCETSNYFFKNLSNPIIDSSIWYFDGVKYNGQPINNAVEIGFFRSGEHKVKMVNKFGTCIDSLEKTFQVRSLLKLVGFASQVVDRCTDPVKFIVKDTTSGAVSWSWDFRPWSKDREISVAKYSFEQLSLRVRDSAGCESSIYMPIPFKRLAAEIRSYNIFSPGNQTICDSGSVNLYVKTDDKIVDYTWNLGQDSSKSAEQVVFYDKPGFYVPQVTLKTDDGCIYKAIPTFSITVRDKLKADFSISGETVCGSTPTAFSHQVQIPPGTYYNDGMVSYRFGDGTSGPSSLDKEGRGGIVHSYRDSGLYTVQMIVTDNVCADTVTKVNYVRVLPPVPKITGIQRTCDGDRLTIKIDYDAKSADSGFWDFGDGSTQPVDINLSQISHTYQKSGRYKIVLTNSKGNCTVQDSVTTYVLKKQNPILSIDKSQVCQRNEDLTLTVRNLELPISDVSTPYYGVTVVDSAGSSIIGDYSYAMSIYDTAYQWTIRSFNGVRPNGGIRLFLTTYYYYQCLDTSNFVPLSIVGPSPGIRIDNVLCPKGNTVNLIDTSVSTHKIVKREWDFGDNTGLITDSVKISHTYPYANDWWWARLTLTDENGCRNFKDFSLQSKDFLFSAAFTSSASTISPGSTVNFTNTSLTTDPSNTSYTWLFGDGSTSTDKSAFKQFMQPGTYQVKLIATNKTKGCSDTASQTIVVKFINTAFSINARFITASKCPPVMVQFNNTSSNISRISWDFGDGGTSTVFNPSHIYTKSGTFIVKVKSYSDNGTEYQATDTVKIAAPTAQLTADSLTGCTNQRTSFKASAQHALNYTWDFGDGTVVTSSDSTARYSYMNSGVFRPKLIVTDVNGCSVATNLKDSVVIDSLNLKLSGLPSQICVPRTVEFNSVAATAVAGQRLDYRWTFGTPNGDGSDLSKPTFNYDKTGKYLVQLTVKTSFGCVRTVSQVIIANQGLGAVINGPAEVCEGSEAAFTATTQIQGSPKWTWIFPDGSISALQNPAALKFMKAGDYQVKLIADNSGCTDTLTKNILVNAKPTAIITERELQICSGSSINLRAQGGVIYKWTPVSGLAKDTGSTVLASPRQTVYYTVNVTSDKGCTANDSVQVKVLQKQKLSLSPEISICSGTTAKLSASGTDKYIWIGNTSGLSSSNIGEPTASPSANITYRVVGSDAAGCFSDTASINVIVNPSPTVDAGNGAEISVGDSYQLKPAASPDVTKYLWTPDRNLSCVTCLSPVASPTESVTYTLRVTNAKGCVATDTVSVEVMCAESKIYIPNVFTPNGDGKNDLFSIKGAGIKVVKSFRIFDRWGKMIFEKKDFQVNDPSASWNGRINGVAVPVGSYIYMAELACDGKTFSRKGTISVVY